MLNRDSFFKKNEDAARRNVNVTPALGQGAESVTRPAAPAPRPESLPERAKTEGGTGSRLIVGPDIKLKGVEITDCDTLVVEGLVEATMDSRVIRIAEMGAFRGSAEIDVAEIRGEFTGNLTVREKLVIYATGKVSGTIHYGKLVIEEGGQLTGQIAFGTATKPVAANKPVIKAAA